MCISRIQEREVGTNVLGLHFKTSSIVCSWTMSINSVANCQKKKQNPASEAAATSFRSKLLTAVLFLLSRFVSEMIQGYSFFLLFMNLTSQV